MTSEDRKPELKELYMNSSLSMYLKIERKKKRNRSRHFYMDFTQESLLLKPQNPSDTVTDAFLVTYS